VASPLVLFLFHLEAIAPVGMWATRRVVHALGAAGCPQGGMSTGVFATALLGSRRYTLASFDQGGDARGTELRGG